MSDMSSANLIEVENLELWTSRPRTKIVGPLSFCVKPHEYLVIRGPNGTGKTTLLKALVGQHNETSGRIVRHFKYSQVSFLPQLSNVLFHIPLKLRDVLMISAPHLSLGRLESKVQKIGLLNDTSLDRDWNSASGGERQRVLLTRALLSDPQILILDEPGNHLDLSASKLLIQTLEDFLSHAPPLKKAIIMVSHETELRGHLPYREIHLHVDLPNSISNNQSTLDSLACDSGKPLP